MKTIQRTKPRRTRRSDREEHVRAAIRQYRKLARYAFPQRNKRGCGRRAELYLWLDGRRMTWLEASQELGISLTLIYTMKRKGVGSNRKDNIRSKLIGRIRFEQSEAA